MLHIATVQSVHGDISISKDGLDGVAVQKIEPENFWRVGQEKYMRTTTIL